MRPRISIIVPCYNGEKYLCLCLESIERQKYTNWECLIINDGSTDNSLKIITDFSNRDSRFKVLNKENGGASSARNIGIDHATGEWITFIDSDDTIDKDYFNIVGLDQVDLAVQRWKFASEQDTRDNLIDGIYLREDYVGFMSETLHKDILRMVAAKFLRRDIIEKHHIRFDTNITLGEDTIFMLEYYRYINSVSVNNTSYYNYYRPDNWSSSKYHISKEQFRYNYKCFYKVYTRLSIQSDELVKFLTEFYLRRICKDNYIFDNLYINTIPEYLKLYKKWILWKGKKAHAKYLIFRAISAFR